MSKRTQKQKLPLTVQFFESPADFQEWLEINHTKSKGIWLRIFKKNSSKVSISYAEALDEALCYGWIDGQKKPYDELSWLQRFTHRRPKSQWSKVNTQHAARLIAAGRMKAAGQEEIDAAMSDGRWDAAYDSFRSSKVPEDFLRILAKDKKAKAFFETLNKTNLYSITYRLQTAKKQETREKRMETILEMLKKGKKFHP